MESLRWGLEGSVSPPRASHRTRSAPRRAATTTGAGPPAPHGASRGSDPTRPHVQWAHEEQREERGEEEGEEVPTRKRRARARPGLRPTRRWVTWIWLCFQWLSAAWAILMQRLARAFQPADHHNPNTRSVLLDELAAAEAGRPRLTRVDTTATGSEEKAIATAHARTTRAASTTAAAARAVRDVREFVERNADLAGGRGEPTHDTYDIVIEAFIFVEAAAGAGGACPWRRARGPLQASAAKGAGTARALLERLGWSRGNAWTRSRAMEASWGVRDPDEGGGHTPPIFCWELVEGLRLRTPRSPWEMAGAAMATIGALHGKRGGGARRLKVGEATPAGEDAVAIATRVRVKKRALASKRGATKPRAFVLRHWLIGAHVLPWLAWHRRQQSPPSALLFPSITERRSPRPTELGFQASGQWVEPMREWSPRQVKTWLQQFVPNLGARAFHGFRAGNNRELRRWKEIHGITRRALHERSLKPLVGSEAHYDEPFAEDYAEATAVLGRMRIERNEQGLLTVTATSASAGQYNDWTGVARPIVLPQDAPGTCSDGSSSDDDTESSDAENVVGEGGRESRRYNCGRCGVAVTGADYGFLCDTEGCHWGTCTSCHPGGLRATLRCPEHA